MLNVLQQLSADEIVGIITGVSVGVAGIIAAVTKLINEVRRSNGNMKCCVTGRPLKPKAKRSTKGTANTKKK